MNTRAPCAVTSEKMTIHPTTPSEDPRPEAQVAERPVGRTAASSTAAMHAPPGSTTDFATFLRCAIRARGVTLTELAEQLRAQGRGVSKATLSHWQSGRSQPDPSRSIGALTALETILVMQPGELVSRLSAPRARGRTVKDVHAGADIEVPEQFVDALAALGFDEPNSIPHSRMAHELLELDSSRMHQTFTYHSVIRATADGIARVPIIVEFETERPAHPPVMESHMGCRVGKRYVDEERSVFGMAVESLAPVQRGSLLLMSYGYWVPMDAEQLTSAHHSIPRRASEVVVEVAFTGPRTPCGLHTFRRDSDGDEVESPAQLDGRHRVQAAATGFGPGTIGVRWQWC